MDIKFETDVAIIGAGPVGLFAVFQCGMAGLKAHVIDSLDQIGGQCTALYPEKPIYDIPAEPSILAGDLIEQLEAQAAPFDPVYHLGQQVVSVDGQQGGFTLKTSKGLSLKVKAVIIAGGAGAFGPNRPPLEGLEDYEGQSVFYAVRNRSQFTGKKIMIAGGGDSAVDWAVSLSEIAAQIYIVHRRSKFRASAASLDKMQALADEGKIEILTPCQLEALHGAAGALQSVDVADMDGHVLSRDVDVLLPFFGLATTLGPIADWGLDLSHHQIVTDQATSQSSVAGIYAIGDMASYPHKLRLILTGFAEAAQAAHHINHSLNPDKPEHFEYSTSKGIPSIS